MKQHAFVAGRRTPWCVHTEMQPGDGGLLVCSKPESHEIHVAALGASPAFAAVGAARPAQHKRPIAAEWASYRERVVPADAGPVQVQECQRAFYAGARALFGTFVSGFSGGPGATEGDFALFDAVEAELREFVGQMRESDPLAGH